MQYNIGIDIGSTTAKMVLLDDRGHLLWSRYERHNAQVNSLLRNYFSEVRPMLGSSPVAVTVTGSVGMAVAEMLQAPFLQEVVAAATYARTYHPEAKALIDIGGEDSKVVLFEEGRTDLRMNGNCAGGTGAFIDQMAALLGLDHTALSEAAMQSTQLHTIAARCGVFAKTDVQSLVARNIPRNDIAASIFHSIAVQTVTTLAHGCDILPPILLCGGPLTFLPALRKAFRQHMQLPDEAYIVDPHSNLIPAIGCALRCIDAEHALTIDLLVQRIEGTQQVSLASSMQPLFADEAEHQAWRKSKEHYSLDIAPMRPVEQVVIGIDSGSTTTKIVACRPDGTLLFTHYVQSLGNPVQAAATGLTMLQNEAQRQGATLQMMGSCSTGYGEELIKAAFGLDHGIVETMAHFRAAQHLKPDVSFILDIGGQDMKAIFVDHGVVTRMELNEACSSGCGTFLQTFAQSMGYTVADFSQIACTAQHPCDLGTRCTVFMNSKVKQVLREGAEIADIAAGLAYSVVGNCLYKVLKLTTSDQLGHSIVLQGGTMLSDAVVRAFELQTSTDVARSSRPELMGAYGCALYAADQIQPTTQPRPVPTDASHHATALQQCRGCENQCQITRHTFASGNTYYSGNKCERIFTNGSATQKGENIYTHKNRLLFNRPTLQNQQSSNQEPKPRLRCIGIPRALGLFENYPFWHRLLTNCGFGVVISSESMMNRYEGSLRTVMSDNICFPAKLMHSHIDELCTKQVERILFPYVVYERQDNRTAIKSYNCPIVAGYSDVVRGSMSTPIPVDSPIINFSNNKLLRKELYQYLTGIGVAASLIDPAIDAALQAQADYNEAIRAEARRIAALPSPTGLTILLAGRPYHTDPLVQHRLSDTLAAMGVNVISEDIVRDEPTLADGETNTVRQWAYVNRIIKAAQWVADHDANIQMVQMTSFGCGPDAFIQDEVRSLLARYGKTLTLVKIDDITNNGSLKLRVRSLIESLQNSRAKNDRSEVAVQDFATTRTYTPADRPKTILAPHISEYVTPLLEALFERIGYRVIVLPPSDSESATLGLRYANNEVCYPATLVVGDIMKALLSGKYPLDNIAVAMSQTGGQCRATNYAGLIKRAMVQGGFADIPLITLGVTTQAGGANEQQGFDIPWRKVLPIVFPALLYADTLAKLYYPSVVRESEAGQAAQLRDHYLQRGAEALRHGSSRMLMQATLEAATDFNHICLDRTVRRVGIVGEIFLKFNHFANQHIADTLVAHGVEVAPPLITPFFSQEFVNTIQNQRLGLSDSRTPEAIINLLLSTVNHRIRRINREVGRRFRYFLPFHDIRQTAQKASCLVSPAAQFGEGWLLPGDVIELADSGVKDVVSLQPFGCLANHIVARGIEKTLRTKRPDINLLNLDFDSGVSSVNVVNRILLFLDSRE